MSPEDAEKWHLDREAVKALQETHTIIERVVAVNQDELGSNEYFVKCKFTFTCLDMFNADKLLGRGIDYSHCTWELGGLVEEHGQPQIDAYHLRQSAVYTTKSDSALSKLRPQETDFDRQPDFIVGGQLKEFQLEGLQFLVTSWYNRKNVILADEMGLGKTVQTVAFLSYLLNQLGQGGPFLVVVPLSTVPAWCETFDSWARDINYIVYHGTVPAKQIIQEHELWSETSRRTKFHVMITTNEQIRLDYDLLTQINFGALIVDEAHVLKNETTQLYQQLAGLKISSKFFLTGTPIQNDLKQLWNLLDFLNPGTVEFDPDLNWELEPGKTDLRNAISPYILQRQKKDVQKDLPLKIEHHLKVPLTPLQLEHYKSIFTKDYEALNKGVSKGKKQSLLNVWAELKKISNHPFLIENAKDAAFERFPQNHTSERANYHETMVRSSNKMMILDRLLGKLKEDGRRVLIFSQMVQMLNILDDYMTNKGYQFQRLDGNIPAAKRQASINHFQEEGSADFCFLLSTRAGGVGINLMAADAVVIFDSDYNPQVDLQAIGRAHRIGQKKEVDIYRLISEHTVDDTIVDRAAIKLRLAAISSDLGDKEISNDMGENDCQRMIKDNAKDLFRQDPADNQRRLDEVDILHEIRNSEKKDTVANGLEGLDGGALLEKLAKQRIELDNMTYEDILPADAIAQIRSEEELKKSEKLAQELSGGRPVRKSRQSRARPAPKQSIMDKELDEEIGSASDDDEDEGEHPNKPLTESEMRRLCRAYERFGSMEDRGDEITEDARLTGRAPEIIQAFITEIRRLSEDAVAQAEERWAKLERKENRALTKKEKGGAVQFKHHHIDMNAQKILRRPTEMKILRQRIRTEPDPLKVVPAQKAPDFTCSWGEREDAMLLLGIDKHGYGSWTSIRDDPELMMQDKMFLEEHRVANKSEKKKVQKPTAAHLIRRTDSLLLVIEEMLSIKETPISKIQTTKPFKSSGQSKKLSGAQSAVGTRPARSSDVSADEKNKSDHQSAGRRGSGQNVKSGLNGAKTSDDHQTPRKRKSDIHETQHKLDGKKRKLSTTLKINGDKASKCKTNNDDTDRKDGAKKPKVSQPAKNDGGEKQKRKSDSHEAEGKADNKRRKTSGDVNGTTVSTAGQQSSSGTLPGDGGPINVSPLVQGDNANAKEVSEVEPITSVREQRKPSDASSNGQPPSPSHDKELERALDKVGHLSGLRRMQTALRGVPFEINSETDPTVIPEIIITGLVRTGRWVEGQCELLPNNNSWQTRLWDFVRSYWLKPSMISNSELVKIYEKANKHNDAIKQLEIDAKVREAQTDPHTSNGSVRRTRSRSPDRRSAGDSRRRRDPYPQESRRNDRHNHDYGHQDSSRQHYSDYQYSNGDRYHRPQDNRRHSGGRRDAAAARDAEERRTNTGWYYYKQDEDRGRARHDEHRSSGSQYDHQDRGYDRQSYQGGRSRY